MHIHYIQIKWDNLDFVGLVRKVVAGDGDVGFMGSDVLQALADQNKVCMYVCMRVYKYVCVCMYISDVVGTLTVCTYVCMAVHV